MNLLAKLALILFFVASSRKPARSEESLSGWDPARASGLLLSF